MKNDTDFKVGQFIRFNHFTCRRINDGYGLPYTLHLNDKKIGKIIAIHPENRKRVEALPRGETKSIRLVPRNVIEIIPTDCVIMTKEEKLAKEIGLLQLHIGMIKDVSPYAWDRIFDHLKSINEIFDYEIRTQNEFKEKYGEKP